MLILVAVSQRHAIVCETGLYALENSDCVDPEECQELQENYRAYQALGRCLPLAPGGVSPKQQHDQSFACEEGSLGISALGNSEGEYIYYMECVIDDDAKANLFAVKGKDAYVDALTCAGLLGMYVITGTKQCVTEDECKGIGWFPQRTSNRPSLQCLENSLDGGGACHAYAATQTCESARPFDLTKFEETGDDRIYKCISGYLDAIGNFFTCVDEKECSSPGKVAHHAR